MSYPPPPGFPPAPPPVVGVGDLGLPLYRATPRQAAVRFWRGYTRFSGRASPSEYWWWVLISTGVSLVLQLVAAAVSSGGFADYFVGGRSLSAQGWLPLTWAAVTQLPSIALAVRRLHDTNRSGWWYLLILPSLVAFVLQIVALGGIGVTPTVDPADPFGLLVRLIPSLVMSLVGIVGSIVLLVFLVSAPDRRGARFDRPPGT